MPANPERIAKIAELFGKDVSGMDLMEAAQVGVDCVFDLLEDLPIPPISKYGVKESDIDNLAEEAMKGGDRWTNPRESTLEDFKCLYKKCLELKK
jgi:alcohol dehydrogenase class IV